MNDEPFSWHCVLGSKWMLDFSCKQNEHVQQRQTYALVADQQHHDLFDSNNVSVFDSNIMSVFDSNKVCSLLCIQPSCSLRFLTVSVWRVSSQTSLRDDNHGQLHGRVSKTRGGCRACWYDLKTKIEPRSL